MNLEQLAPEGLMQQSLLFMLSEINFVQHVSEIQLPNTCMT